MSTLLDIQNLSISLSGKPILKDLSLQVPDNGFTAILGPSGCGKSTLFRCIAGFEPHQKGQIQLNGVNLGSQAPHKRQIGLVFQDWALFSHLNVEDNIKFGISGLRSSEQKERLDHLSSILEIEDTRKKYPHEISGGQQQRVALARAIAPRPKLLMLDEPFSNLDTRLREVLSVDVRQILKEEGISGLLVTHNLTEAFAFADNIGILFDGHIQQFGKPDDIYHRPKNLFVAKFLGNGTLIPIQKLKSGIDGLLQTGQPKLPKTINNLYLRPEHIQVKDGPNKAIVNACYFKGNAYIIHLQCKELSLIGLSSHPLQEGTTANFTLDFEKAIPLSIP